MLINSIKYLSTHRSTKRVLSISCCLKTHIVWVSKVNSLRLFWMLNTDVVFFHFVSRKRSPISHASHVCPVKKGAYLLPWQPGSAERWLGRRQEKGQSAQVKTQICVGRAHMDTLENFQLLKFDVIFLCRSAWFLMLFYCLHWDRKADENSRLPFL